jgi:hypothetical protein
MCVAIASEAGSLAMSCQLDLRRMSRITRLLLRPLGNFLPWALVSHSAHGDAFRMLAEQGGGCIASIDGHAELDLLPYSGKGHGE